jgi:hypothetical protein
MWPREIDLLAVVIAEPLARLDSPVIGEPTFRSKALREAMNRPLVRGAHIHPRDGCELLLTQSKRYQGMRGREWVFDLVRQPVFELCMTNRTGFGSYGEQRVSFISLHGERRRFDADTAELRRTLGCAPHQLPRWRMWPLLQRTSQTPFSQ